nr:PREDICTED: uncharacterized protein LOC104152099 isoform X4 [Struthio camelus australis]
MVCDYHYATDAPVLCVWFFKGPKTLDLEGFFLFCTRDPKSWSEKFSEMSAKVSEMEKMPTSSKGYLVKTAKKLLSKIIENLILLSLKSLAESEFQGAANNVVEHVTDLFLQTQLLGKDLKAYRSPRATGILLNLDECLAFSLLHLSMEQKKPNLLI